MCTLEIAAEKIYDFAVKIRGWEREKTLWGVRFPYIDLYEDSVLLTLNFVKSPFF